MASAQVMKKQEHLAAGKKKLEEFRRKRAAAKKASSSNVINEKQPSETENVRVIDSNGVGTSDALAEGRLETSNEVAEIANKGYDISSKSDFSSSNKNVSSSLSDRNSDFNGSVHVHSYSNNDDASMHLDEYQSSKDKFLNREDEYGVSVEVPSGIGKSYLYGHRVSSADGLDKYPSNDIRIPEMDVADNATTPIFNADIMPKDFVSSLGNSKHEDNKLTTTLYRESHHSSTNINDSTFGFKPKLSMFSGSGEKKIGSAFDNLDSTNRSSSWTSDEKFSDYNSESQSSSNHRPPSPPASGRRLRPSFLDSIQISNGPSSSPPLFGTEKDDILSSKANLMDGLKPSVSQRLINTSAASGDGIGLFNHIKEDKHNFFSHKQNEDFAALEQHIEDLTQEKFSLQRALEASRALAESLASENSALTDSYNQQGMVVNQLKTDLERLQEEVKAQLVELNSVKMEYANAQLECDAADERSKLLASEVIALEEKALRLRSNELKLERELENTKADISSNRKRMSSLEKDRQDLQSTINALQEEKKLLQSKLWAASSSGKSVDFSKTSTAKIDVSTSTEDLADHTDTNTTMESANLGDSHSQFSPENVHLDLEALPVAFPSDQIRMIENINTLIAELALEREQLMQALSAQSSQSSKLSELNKDLTRKLEAQTQRLELLMAQSMVNDNNQLRHHDIPIVHENTPYADEGDEVVERVLGWIMKLFPGGPSRKRPSKHL